MRGKREFYSLRRPEWSRRLQAAALPTISRETSQPGWRDVVGNDAPDGHQPVLNIDFFRMDQ